MQGFDLGFVPSGENANGINASSRKKKKKKSKDDDQFDVQPSSREEQPSSREFEPSSRDWEPSSRGWEPYSRGEQPSSREWETPSQEGSQNSWDRKKVSFHDDLAHTATARGIGYNHSTEPGAGQRVEHMGCGSHYDNAHMHPPMDAGTSMSVANHHVTEHSGNQHFEDFHHHQCVTSFGNGTRFENELGTDSSDFDRSLPRADVTPGQLKREPILSGLSLPPTDMHGGSCSSRSNPHYVGNSPLQHRPPEPAPRWNPLEGIKRNWSETGQDPPPTTINQVSSLARKEVHATPSSLLTHDSLEQELAKRETRVNALKSTIASLESGLSPCPDGNRVKVMVVHPLDGERLGLSLRSTTVAAFADPRAQQFGFAIGDRILQINHFSVVTSDDFARELTKALQVHRATGRPLEFDIWRSHSAMMSSTPHAPPPAHSIWPHCASPHGCHSSCREASPMHGFQAQWVSPPPSPVLSPKPSHVAAPPFNPLSPPIPPPQSMPLFPTTGSCAAQSGPPAMHPFPCDHRVGMPGEQGMYFGPGVSQQPMHPLQPECFTSGAAHPGINPLPHAFMQAPAVHPDLHRLHVENAMLSHENAMLRGHAGSMSAVDSHAFGGGGMVGVPQPANQCRHPQVTPCVLPGSSMCHPCSACHPHHSPFFTGPHTHGPPLHA